MQVCPCDEPGQEHPAERAAPHRHLGGGAHRRTLDDRTRKGHRSSGRRHRGQKPRPGKGFRGAARRGPGASELPGGAGRPGRRGRLQRPGQFRARAVEHCRIAGRQARAQREAVHRQRRPGEGGPGSSSRGHGGLRRHDRRRISLPAPPGHPAATTNRRVRSARGTTAYRDRHADGRPAGRRPTLVLRAGRGCPDGHRLLRAARLPAVRSVDQR